MAAHIQAESHAHHRSLAVNAAFPPHDPEGMPVLPLRAERREGELHQGDQGHCEDVCLLAEELPTDAQVLQAPLPP